MSDLFAIGASGVRAYQTALGTTSENIANAGVAGYSRRTTTLNEIGQTNNVGFNASARPNGSGVAVAGVARAGDMFRIAEARSAGTELAKTEGGIVWMERVETALTGNKLAERMTAVFSAADQVAADPAAIAPRAVFLEKARALTAAFDGSGQALDAAQTELGAMGQDAVTRLSDLATNLSRVNAGLARTSPDSVGQAQLLDERDRLLEGMASLVDVDVQTDTLGRATVRAGGTGGPALVDPQGFGFVSFASNGSGAASLTLYRGGEASAVTAHGGAIAGLVDGAARLAGARQQLDALATQFTDGMNALQAAGRDLDGAPGAPMFAVGARPTDITLSLDDPRGLAVAAPGEGARGNGNFADLADWRRSGNLEGRLDDMTAGNAAALAARRDVASAQGSIRDAAVSARDSYSAVDLDEEAVNLIRFQQAYQASSRVIQVARDILQTIIDIR